MQVDENEIIGSPEKVIRKADAQDYRQLAINHEKKTRLIRFA